MSPIDPAATAASVSRGMASGTPGSAPSAGTPAPAGQGPAAVAPPMMHATVMMIDDDPQVIAAASIWLADAGWHDVSGESNPRRGLERLRAEQPDVLLLDLMMPEISGFDVLAQIRADPQLQRMPVIVMTSASDASTKMRALTLGATDFLAKPIDDPSELVLRLRNTLAFKAYRDRSAWFDMQTGLPNLSLLTSQIARALRRRANGGGDCALLVIELGRLRQLAETLGPRTADEALTRIAARLRDGLGPGDAGARAGEDRPPAIVARLGSDEFAVLLHGLANASDAAAVATRAQGLAATPIEVQGRPWTAQVSVGVATAPDDAIEGDALLRCARSAVSGVRAGGGGMGFYSARLNAAAVERLALEADLRRALDDGSGFELHYQPKVDARTGELVACEALVRWRHPERGLVHPAAFVPIAEETGLIDQLDAWVLGEACRAARRWRDAGTPCRVSVNIAASHFRDDRLLADLRAALDAAGVEPGLLTIELTESMLMDGIDGSLRTLSALRALGVSISLDDFGTGWSSLTYLKRMPIDELKIDRSFVSGLPGDAGDSAIVRSVITLAASLGLTVVAEGVETREQADWLAREGCDLLQGWLFAKALEEPVFVEWLVASRVAVDA
ncbi:MAG: putative bifunctional diguanylate cyclase/phosphodiesterase [Burkholderiales bacterium]